MAERPPNSGDPDRLGELLGDLFERGVDPRRVPEGPPLPPSLDAPLAANLRALDALDWAFEPQSPSPGPPAVLGDFRIVREIGRGGMGVVYEAEQVSLRRRVALKVLHPGVGLDARAVQRFRAEARTASQLHHTNLVPVHAMGEERGTWWYAMDLVEGRTLDLVIEDLRRLGAGEPAPETAGPATPGSTLGSGADGPGFFVTVARLFAGVAEALQAAHGAGVVHRDVKPSNLILGPDGTLKLMDFGLAFVPSGRSFATVSGGVVGTPAYMSPEQARGEPVDGRADVYGLGATLYEVLTLRPAVKGGDLPDVVRRVLTREPPEPRRLERRIPRDLETVVLKALEKDPDRRYATAAAMAEDLRDFARGGAVRARRVGVLRKVGRKALRHKAISALVLCVALLGAGGAVFAVRAAEERTLNRRLEYERRLAAADLAFAVGLIGSAAACAPGEERSPAADEPALLYAEAIAADPSRPEAYLGRGLIPGDLPARLADLDAARERGLSPRTWRLGRAVALLHSGAVRRSEEEARAAPEASGPARPLDALLEGRLFGAWGRHEEAIESLTSAVRTASAGSALRTRALLERAGAWERMGDPERAFEDLSAAAGTGGLRRPGVRVRLALLWRRIGNVDRAEHLFEEVLREVSARGETGAWVEVCQAASAESEPPRWSDRATQEALRRHPDLECLGVLRADVLTGLGRPEDALALVDRLLAAKPGDPALRRHRARHLLALGRPEQALEVLGTAGSEEEPALRVRFETLRALRRGEDALAVADALIARRPLNASYRSMRGAVLCDLLQRHEEAVIEFQEAIRLFPGQPIFHQNLSVAEWERGRRDESLAALDRATRLDRDNRKSWGMLGDRLRQRGDFTGAAKAYREAVRIAPDSFGDWMGLGNALTRAADLAEAEQAFRQAIRVRPDDPSAHYNLANTLKRLGHLEEAIDGYRTALRFASGHAAARVNLGQCLLARGRAAEAVTETEAALPGLTDPAQVLIGWATLGDARAGAGDAVGAEKAYREALRLDPAHSGVRRSLARLLEGAGRRAEALGELEEGVRQAPDDVDAVCSLAAALRSRGRFHEAHRIVRQAIGEHPDSAKAYVELGNLLDTQKDRDGALAAYAKALERDPRSAVAHHEIGVLWREASDAAKAVPSLRRAVELAPAFADYRIDLGVALLRSGDPAGAVRQLEEAVRLRPDLTMGHFHLGIAHHLREEWDQARASLRRVVDAEPRFTQAQRYLGASCRALAAAARAEAGGRGLAEGLEQEALQAYARAAELDPADAESTRVAAELHERCERFEESLRAYEETIRRAPQEAAAYVGAARCLMGLGRFEEALARLREGTARDPADSGPEVEVLELLLGLRRYEEAVAASGRAIERLGARPALVRAQVTALRALGRAAEARDLAREALPTGAPPGADGWAVAHLRAVAGDRRGAEEVLAGLPEPGTPRDRESLARVHAVLGEGDLVVLWLRKAGEAGLSRHADLSPDPEFLPYAGHPGFREAWRALSGR